ncbi:MAG: HNH endonuclease [bacterium]
MRKRKWSKDQLIKSVSESTSYRQVLKKLALVEAGGNYTQIKKYVLEYNVSIAHFTGRGWSKGKKFSDKTPLIPTKDILVVNSTFQSHKLKKRLFKEGLKEKKCEICGWNKTTAEGRLPLELDHINGDNMDNRISNLQILCPNCHSLQPTHRGLNKNKKARVVEW